MKSNTFKNSILIGVICAVLACACVLCGCSASGYKPEKKSSTVQSSALVKAGTLTVGLNVTDNVPLASKTSGSSKYQGIDVDMAYAIADELGLNVEFVDIGSSAATALSNKKADIVMGIDSANSTSGTTLSSAYVATGSCLFAKDGNTTVPTADNCGKILGVMASGAVMKAQNQFGAVNVSIKNDLNSCFSELDSGSAKYVAADAVKGTYAVLNNGSKAKIVAMLQRPSGYCAGTLSSNTELAEKVKNAVDTLVSKGECDVIANKWLATSLNLDNIPLTEGASNEALGSDLDSGVYGEINNTASQN